MTQTDIVEGPLIYETGSPRCGPLDI